MNARTVICWTIAWAGAGALALYDGPPSLGSSGEGTTVNSAIVSTYPSNTEDFEYVGSKKCKMCHIKEHKSWAKTKMGQALDTLKPGSVAEVKKKFNLDPQKDYTTDPECIRCHTTGFGQPGGYVIADAGDKKAVKHAKKLANVGCESCHGPGGKYVDLHKELLMSKRKYTWEEMSAAGMRKVDVTTCRTCHNGEGPTTEKDHPFDFEQMRKKDAHENFPLKQRKE